MDPISLATAAAVLLATKGGEALAGEAGRQAWKGIGRLVALVRDNFRGDQPAEEALVHAQAAPADDAQVQRLADAVRAHAQANESFRRELEQLIDEAKADPVVGGVVVQLSDQARIEKQGIFGTVQGDVTF